MQQKKRPNTGNIQQEGKKQQQQLPFGISNQNATRNHNWNPNPIHVTPSQPTTFIRNTTMKNPTLNTNNPFAIFTINSNNAINRRITRDTLTENPRLQSDKSRTDIQDWNKKRHERRDKVQNRFGNPYGSYGSSYTTKLQNNTHFENKNARIYSKIGTENTEKKSATSPQ